MTGPAVLSILILSCTVLYISSFYQ